MVRVILLSQLRSLALILSFILSFLVSAQTSAQFLPDFTELVERSAPAIVNVRIRSTITGDDRFDGFEGDREELEEFLEFFGDRFPDDFNMRERGSSSLGSGFIISEDGYIVTNHHVIDGADEITITLNDQRQFTAEVIGSDPRSDLALIKIAAEGLPTVPFGDVSEVKVGQWVLAIGSPFNLSHSVAAGIVSFVGRSLPPQITGQGNYVSFIQTDVAINPGHSGGPLFNLEGEVIGVNSQIYSNSGGSIGLSFAIPVDVAANVVNQLMQSGNVSRGWMGVAIADVTQEQADVYNLATPQGAFVNDVLPGGPAEAAGFQAEDIILRYAGDEIRNSADLPYHVGLSLPGSEVEVELIRDGRLENIRLLVGDLDAASSQQQLQLGTIEPIESSLGLSVSELTAAEKQRLGLDYGLRVDEVTGLVAERAGLQKGDIILSLNGRALDSLANLAEISASLPSDSPLPLLVERDGQQSFFTLMLDG
ncbi:MAG: serine peptidase [SAR86 cluster bacterium]|uniref:Probable periplasmic serine endoprotease DegP-like n=1 Tax=SAR86 cluster bacterium TaxID=2030880 RepID=A0A2A5C979_9GAMM|nr:MAG: serine peptidase [SAR86 cluster bacterium]